MRKNWNGQTRNSNGIFGREQTRFHKDRQQNVWLLELDYRNEKLVNLLILIFSS